MMGYSLETIYLVTLIVCGLLTFVYIFLSDVLEGIFQFIPDGVLNPTLVLSFLTVSSAAAYLFESFTPMNSVLGLIISLLLALVFVTLLHIFVLVPLSSAEASLNYSEEDLKGRIGKVITSIPEDGFGEVILEGTSGTIAKPAKGFDNERIPIDTKVLVIDVKNGVLHVSKHDGFS